MKTILVQTFGCLGNHGGTIGAANCDKSAAPNLRHGAIYAQKGNRLPGRWNIDQIEVKIWFIFSHVATLSRCLIYSIYACFQTYRKMLSIHFQTGLPDEKEDYVNPW